MYKGVVEYIKTQLETEFDNVYVGEQDWQNIFKIGKPIVEILPTTATRAPEGMSGIGNEEWEIQINVATKGMSMDSEEMEIDNLEHMMTVVDLFKSDSTSVDGYPVRFRVNSNSSLADNDSK